MKKLNKFLIIFFIIILILGIMMVFFNKSQKSTTLLNAPIKVSYSSSTSQNDNTVKENLTLSQEKTTEAMNNNSKVLQEIIDEVSNSGGGTIQLPAGTYYFAPTGTYIEQLETGGSEKKAYYAIECKSNVKLVGAGTNENDINSCTILKPYGENLDVSLTMFQYINADQPKKYIENADFEGFIINADETSKDPNSGYVYRAQGKGFAFSPFKDCDWNNVVVKNTDGTGFGMDLPINCTITNCVAIGCGKAATENDVGASGFGIGTGYSENESMKISNCTAIGNRKFGFFFEHQGRFVSVVKSKTAKGFIVTDCVAKGNMYNFGGEKANDVIYERCVSENSTNDDPNPLGNGNTQAFYFGMNSRKIYLEGSKVEQKYDNITDDSEFYYDPVYWAANHSIIDIGEKKSEYNAIEDCPKAEAIVMLWRLAGRPGEVLIGAEHVNTGYDDVSYNDWYADAVAWAYNAGIVDGGTLNPSEGCPRAHFIIMLWRYAGSPIVSTGNNYTDVSEGDFFEDAVNWAISEQIIIPQETEYKPAEVCSRAEILTLLYRYNLSNPQKTVIYDYWQNGGYDADKVYDFKKKNENIDLTVKAQKEGYEFVGWSTNKNDTEAKTSLTMQSEGIDLYAIYKRSVELTYNANEGEGEPAASIGTMYNSETSIDITISDTKPTREGYIFKGWTDEEESTEVKYEPGETYEFSDSKTLYAVWENNNYTLTINPNGGEWNNSTEVAQITGNNGTVVDIPNPVAPIGYTVTFEGNGGETSKKEETSRKEFVNWEEEGEGTLNGTTYTFGEGSGTITAKYREGSIELPEAEREGYQFVGWYTEESEGTKRGNAGESYTPTEEETLYAHWEANKYTIKFDGNGATSGNMSDLEMTYGQEESLPTNEYQKTGYTFKGWSEDKDATEAQYVEGANVNNLTTENGEIITLYAIWEKNITIIYNANEGEGEPAASTGTMYNSATSVTITISDTKPTREGYTFKGWTDEEESTEVKYNSGETYEFSDSKMLYAVWEANKYTIRFDGNGATSGIMSELEMTYGQEKSLPTNAYQKTGYTFKGWNEDKEATEAQYAEGESVNNLTIENGETITLYAIWEANKYTIRFDGNGATGGNMSDLEMTYGQEKNLPTNTYQKTGYTFKGWSEDKDATEAQYAEGENVNNLTIESGEIITLYAIWEKSITITYNANEGKGEPTASTGIMYNSETSVEITISDTKPTREGYTFKGWTDEEESTEVKYNPGETYEFSDSKMLYAVWEKNNYTLTINPNGGEWNNSTEVVQITGNNGTVVDIANPVAPIGYTVTFEGNGGEAKKKEETSRKEFISWEEEGEGTLSGTTYTFGEGSGTITAKYREGSIELPEAEREGYQFVGWYTEESEGTKRGNAGESYTPTEEETLYAHWEVNKYTIKFDGNGATSGSMSDLGMTYGQEKNLPTNAYQKTGYTFKGWSEDKDATEAQYAEGANVNNLTIESGEIITLYAIWEKSITITYNANEGEGEPTASTGTMYNSETSVNIIISDTKPTREGYTFKGWTDEEESTEVKYNPGETYEFSDSKTLYAIWEKNSYTLTINPNGGEWNNSTEVAQITGNNGTVVDIQNPVAPTGYTVTFEGNGGEAEKKEETSRKEFVNWEEEGDGTLSGTTYTFGEGSGTITAKYREGSIELPGAEREGYQFVGWYTEESEGTKRGNAGESYTPTEEETLYAHWEANKYTIKFDGNGATSGSMSDLEMTYGQEKSLPTNEYQKTGYTFKGWNEDKEATEAQYAEGENVNNLTTENGEFITLYAVWEKNEIDSSHMVTYNYWENGGFDTDKEQEEKKSGENIDLSVEAKKEGYEFVGWSTDKDSKVGLNTLIMEDEDITLYAIFKKDLKLTFIDYKDTEQNKTEKDITIYNNEKGQTTAPFINEYSDWIIRYWTTGNLPNSEEAIGTGELITNIEDSQTYYARYTKEIAINFDLNEGEGIAPETIKGNIEVNSNNISKVEEMTIIIPNAEISREGFSFVGWMTKKDESGVDYEIEKEASFDESITLYARWMKNSEPSIDNVLPILEIEYSPSNEWTNQDIKLNISTKDEDSGIEKVTLNNEVIFDEDGSVEYIIKQNGMYNIEATDMAGNTIRKTITISNIDKNSPEISNIEQVENSNTGAIEINVISTDNESGINRIEYSYDNETWNDCLDETIQKDFSVVNYVYKVGESTITINWRGKEDKTIYFRAVDEAGNIGEEDSIVIDTEENKNDNEPPIGENTVINNNTDDTNNQDDGRSNKILPYVGIKSSIFIVPILILVISAVVFIKKYKDLKDVK